VHRPRSQREPSELVAAVSCAAALVAGACATAASEPARAPSRHALDARFEEPQRAVYTPPPEPTATSGDSIALRAADASEAARRVALAMVQALLESDAAALQRLFAERVVFGLEAVGRRRAELVDRCIEETRSLAYEPDLRPEQVVDVRAIEVQRADRFHAQVPLPPGLRPSDLLVTLPPRSNGTEARSRVPCVTAVYVRAGERTAIVGLTR
jgi:hypothetical protein